MNYIVTGPAKMGCYVQTSNPKTISEVQTETGADVIVNFQLFNMSTLAPVLCFKVGGKVLANDGTNYWGYAWNNNDKTFALGRRDDIMAKYGNFAGSVLVAQNGKAITNPEYASLFPGSRGRTCIGRKADGSILIYCWPDGSSGVCTIQALGQKMVDLGCVDAVNYDGGGSTQLICPAGKVGSTRSIGSFLWFRMAACPYTEPTFNIQQGSAGEGASWVQWMLRDNGAAIAVDGAFGPASTAALKEFQKAKGLDNDGVCGSETRKALKGNTTSSMDNTPPAETGNSPLVSYTCLSPYGYARTGKIDKITIHHAAGVGTAESIGANFDGRRGTVSANYGIGNDGKIGLYVPENKRAVTSSNTANDNRAVTIEVSNSEARYPWPVSDAAYAALLDLVTDICRRNGIEKLNYTGDASGNLTMHCMFAATACPGKYLQERFPAIAEEVNKRLNGENVQRYNAISEMPSWAQETVRKLCDNKILVGSGAKDKNGYPTDLDLSMDMLRLLEINDRAGLY